MTKPSIVTSIEVVAVILALASLAIFITLFVVSGQPNWLGLVAPILILVTAGFRLRNARPRSNAR